MALSRDIREKVVKAIPGGMSRRQAAARFDVGPATAVRGAQRVETTGDVAPMKMGGDHRSQRIEAHAEFILKEIKAKPDMTIMELRVKLRERPGLGFGYGTVWRFLARHRITRRKKTGHPSEQEREDVEAAREGWFDGQLNLDPLKLVFIDESVLQRHGRGSL
jgi:transposase